MKRAVINFLLIIVSCIAIFFLFWAIRPAMTQVIWTFRPPPEFDKPFDGELIIERLSREEIQKVCPPGMLACAWTTPNNKDVPCIVMIPDDDFLKKRGGMQYEEILRHEIGHCNGWPADHGGAYLKSNPPEQPTQPTHNFPPKMILMPKPKQQQEGDWQAGRESAEKFNDPRK
jgi:hypothetical protein